MLFSFFQLFTIEFMNRNLASNVAFVSPVFTLKYVFRDPSGSSAFDLEIPRPNIYSTGGGELSANLMSYNVQRRVESD